MIRKRDQNDEVGGSCYTLVKHLPVTSFRGLRNEINTARIDDDDEDY